jgi:hypothetical protein
MLKIWRRKAQAVAKPIAGAEDTQCAGEARWRVAATSVTGVGHLEAGQGCDDAWFIGETRNGIVVAVVSDGAGSAPMGAFAAQTICTSFEELVTGLVTDGGETSAVEQTDTYWDKVLSDVDACLTRARTKLIDHAASSNRGADDYLATVVGVVADPVSGVLCFHIGDGAITIFDAGGAELLTSQPENGEFLNQTYFLVEEAWQLHRRVARLSGRSAASIFLMTDGVTDLGFHRRGRILTPEPAFFAPLTAFLQSRPRDVGEAGIAKVLDAERARELVDDDKTLVWLSLV